MKTAPSASAFPALSGSKRLARPHARGTNKEIEMTPRYIPAHTLRCVLRAYKVMVQRCHTNVIPVGTPGQKPSPGGVIVMLERTA